MPISDSARCFGTGKTAFFRALDAARILLTDPDIDACIVSAVDSLLNGPCLAWLENEEHLKTESNSDGIIPGEAAAAVWVSRPDHPDHSQLDVLGIGFSDEPSVANPRDPNLAIGLAAAMRAALEEAGLQLHEIDYRVGGMAGERADFMEASTAFARVLKVQRSEFQLWVPAEKLGDVGAALPACMVVVTAIGMSKHYAPGSTAIASIASRSGDRAACVLAQPVRGNHGL
jgi:3-oxoacyl-[acyl-carrier-protein] synthase-1